MFKEQDLSTQLVVYVGTGKLVALLGDSLDGQSRVVRHKSLRNPEGFKSGMVTNLEQAARVLGTLVEEVLGDQDIDTVDCHVVLGNSKLRTYSYSSSQYYQGSQRTISPHEIRSVMTQTKSVATLPLSEIVLQAIPQSFLVNDMDDIQNPIGLEAQRLGVNLKIFTMTYREFKNIQKVFEAVDIEPYGYYSKTLTTSEAILSNQEKQEGALIVDIAEDVTHFSLWKNGYLAETTVMEMGGAFLTERIAEQWKIDNHDACKVKERYASFEQHNFMEEMIPLVERNGQGRHQIRRQDFHSAFNQLAREWVAKILKEGREFAQQHHVLYPHYVLTGGGTRMDGFLEFLQTEFSQNARIGLPRKVEASGDLIVDPSVAAPLGMYRWLSKQGSEHQKLFAPKGILEKTLSSARHWFATYF